MSELLKITLPGLPPTLNHLYRTAGSSRRYKTKEGRKWQEETARALAQAWQPKETLRDDAAVRVIFTTEDRRRWDLDNRLKALLDALQMARVIANDSQIKRLTAERWLGAESKTLIIAAAVCPLRGDSVSELLKITLPGLPPTLNHLYRTAGSSRRYKTKEGREWQQQTARALAQAWQPKETFRDDAAVRIIFTTADRRRWDLDNRLKALFDAFQMARVIANDSQIKWLTVERWLGAETKTLINLEEYNNFAQEPRKRPWKRFLFQRR